MFYALIKNKTINAKHIMRTLHCSLLLQWHRLWWAASCSLCSKAQTYCKKEQWSAATEIALRLCKKGHFPEDTTSSPSFNSACKWNRCYRSFSCSSSFQEYLHFLVFHSWSSGSSLPTVCCFWWSLTKTASLFFTLTLKQPYQGSKSNPKIRICCARIGCFFISPMCV